LDGLARQCLPRHECPTSWESAYSSWWVEWLVQAGSVKTHQTLATPGRRCLPQLAPPPTRLCNRSQPYRWVVSAPIAVGAIKLVKTPHPKLTLTQTSCHKHTQIGPRVTTEQIGALPHKIGGSACLKPNAWLVACHTHGPASEHGMHGLAAWRLMSHVPNRSGLLPTCETAPATLVTP
jgi:hypothetical protein